MRGGNWENFFGIYQSITHYKPHISEQHSCYSFGCGSDLRGYGMCAAVMVDGYSILIASIGFILLALNAE